MFEREEKEDAKKHGFSNMREFYKERTRMKRFLRQFGVEPRTDVYVTFENIKDQYEEYRQGHAKTRGQKVLE